MNKQIELATQLAELITSDYEDYLSTADLLDYLKELKICLMEDHLGLPDKAYEEHLRDLRG